ncbi:MAG: DsbC family protein, partial [Pseudolysinimonas sp.]
MITAGLAATAGAIAADLSPAVAERVREAVVAYTQGKVSVDSVSSTPVPGVYLIASDGEVFYVDESGRYSFVGSALIDLKTQTDLTAPVLDALQSIDFDRLPLHLAIKQVHGNGNRKIALFEDPNCPICRVFTKFVDQLDDVTVYRFMYPVISPQSQSLARIAWCSRDKATAWRDIMNGMRPAGDESCDVTGVANILKLGEKHRIMNTPTVFLGNGKR